MGVLGNMPPGMRNPATPREPNEPMAFFTLEDLTGKSVAVTVFPSIFREVGAAVEQDRIILLEGRISVRERVRDDEEGGRNVELLADKIRLLGAGVAAAVYLHVHDGLAVRKVESRRLTVDLSNGLASLVESLVGRQEVRVD
jgi:DNA polymerase III alpha subunit